MDANPYMVLIPHLSRGQSRATSLGPHRHGDPVWLCVSTV